MSLPELFEQLVGHAPSAEERDRLERIQSIVGMRDNDAFGAIVATLEQYNGFFAGYPAKISAETGRILSDARATLAALAKAELTECQSALVRHVTEASLELSRQRLARGVTAPEVTLAAASLVTFGAICVTAGYNLASRARPIWMSARAPEHGLEHVASAVLGAPAGWIVFVLLLPGAAYGVRYGWAIAREAGVPWWHRASGWGLVTLSTVGALSLILLLLKLA